VNFGALENDVENAFSEGDPFEVLSLRGGPIDPPLRNLQGGTFTPWGDLYLANGIEDPPLRIGEESTCFNSRAADR
jgi:hypothetical protein